MWCGCKEVSLESEQTEYAPALGASLYKRSEQRCSLQCYFSGRELSIKLEDQAGKAQVDAQEVQGHSSRKQIRYTT